VSFLPNDVENYAIYSLNFESTCATEVVILSLYLQQHMWKTKLLQGIPQLCTQWDSKCLHVINVQRISILIVISFLCRCMLIKKYIRVVTDMLWVASQTKPA